MTARPKTLSAMENVKSSYDAPPSWVIALAEECDKTSQASVAGKIGRSPSLINQVLKNRYTGDLHDVRQRVEALLQPACIHCPIIGEISGEACIQNQGKPYNPGNHLAVRLFRACRQCPNRIVKKGGEDDQ